jgi:hypothetical protein
MTKILNLDDIEQSEDKTVVLNTVSHKFHPFTVDEFITQLKEIEAIEAGGSVMSATDYAEFSIRTVQAAFPTIKETDLRALTIGKLKALTDFVKDVAKTEAVAGAEALAEPGNAVGEAS